ncbi:uncharacterized, partial [Tachysurus ichikawai]
SGARIKEQRGHLQVQRHSSEDIRHENQHRFGIVSQKSSSAKRYPIIDVVVPRKKPVTACTAVSPLMYE